MLVVVTGDEEGIAVTGDGAGVFGKRDERAG